VIPHLSILPKEETWAAFKHDRGSGYEGGVDREELAKRSHHISALNA